MTPLNWIKNYLAAQHAALDSLPVEAIEKLARRLLAAQAEGRRIFAIGNGGSAANASHFITDLGKGASDALGKRFNCLSLTDNVSWITALGNDYAYEEIFVRQLENYAQPGDFLLAASVSGNSPNLVKAFEWARRHGLHTVALASARGGKLAELAETVIKIESSHYGHAEDCQMTIYHLLCYIFIEKVLPEPEGVRS